MKRLFFLLLIGLGVLLNPAISQARWLSAEIGRFITMDTFPGNQKEPQSIHKYLYTQNDPVNGSDPTGFWTEIDSDLYFGKDAEEPVVADFLEQRPYIPAQKLGISIHGLLDYNSNTGYNGFGRLIPDLVDGVKYEIYDVKSWNQVGVGMAKIEAYRAAFNIADNDQHSVTQWHAGTTYNYLGPNPVPMPRLSGGKAVYAVYFPTEAGVIPYKLYRVDNQKDMETIPVPVIEPVSQRNTQTQAMPAGGMGLAPAYASYNLGASLYLNFAVSQKQMMVSVAGLAGIGAVTAIATRNSMEGAP